MGLAFSGQLFSGLIYAAARVAPCRVTPGRAARATAAKMGYPLWRHQRTCRPAYRPAWRRIRATANVTTAHWHGHARGDGQQRRRTGRHHARTDTGPATARDKALPCGHPPMRVTERRFGSPRREKILHKGPPVARSGTRSTDPVQTPGHNDSERPHGAPTHRPIWPGERDRRTGNVPPVRLDRSADVKAYNDADPSHDLQRTSRSRQSTD
jgi:hypothetical protein